MRTSGTVIAWTLLVALLCGCSGPAPAPPAQPARPVLAKPAQAAATAASKSVQAPSVTIGGEDAAETVARWQPPLPALERAQLARARRDAARALAEDRLFEDPQSAIPLYLAIRALAPQDPVARDGLRKARRRLLQLGDDLLRASEQQEQAPGRADRIAMVALSLDADDPAVRRLQQRVETAQRVLAYNRAGEDDLRAGRLGEDGNGALANFREALQLDADDARARQGVAAVESALIRRAEAAARLSDFAAAGSWLARAARIRDAAATVRDARVRVEGVRTARIAVLRDAGLRDLATPAGLKAAREKLGDVLRIADPGDPVAAMLRERIDLATYYGSFRPGQVFTDAMSSGERGPQMIVVPHGGFRMGASDSEPGAMPAEQPLHYVRFDRGFAMSITEVTVAEFRRFVEVSGARPRATRRGHSIVYDERSGNFVRRSGTDWQSGYNGARAAPNSPVMHVSVRDAEAYAAWLSQQTGRHYRLPSEAEFEYALRAGGRGRYPWGNAGTPPPGAGNFTGGGDVSPGGRHWNNSFVGYADGFWGPAPVASFKANAWGLHDMGGNLSEWVADCWHSSYRRAPADGASWYNPGCRSRVVRGGNWANAPEQTRSAWRLMQDSDTTSARVGFRLVRGI
ncbi:formylglycine-generating enzyme family protein [Xanthomonas cerealis]|uniref:formylglycine-generating enzyme family protein n=1 Tax=Xanthomonas cerealis TaxID=3390025 RepID=UPI000A989CA8|nr:formylglycine-generating enzyme family protein [Xanthomonas translucens]UKE68354.1 formylglycine-generating enzyme family protein [Xanthomonas translucens pv. pistacia]